MRVNLFDYAKGELSQDAFLSWLAQNADEAYTEDRDLHAVAQMFVKKLLGKYSRAIKTVEVEQRQWEKIDVSFTVNDDMFVIIEDKAGSGLHDDQLNRYKKIAGKWANGEGRKLCCWYFNSRNPVAEEIGIVDESGYSRLLRKDLLKVLDGYNGKNAILIDYREKLHTIENDTESYKTLPFPKWTVSAWQGFYEWLRALIGDCNWNYAANKAGGLWWFQWRTGQIRGGLDFYLQFEHHPDPDKGLSRLCFKAYDKSKKMMPRVAPALRAAIESIRDANKWNEIGRADRFKTNGMSCTIMCVPMECLTDGGKVRLNTFLKTVKRYEKIVDDVRSRVEFALNAEKNVKEFLTGDVIQSLKSISGFEWKAKASNFALEDCYNGSIRYIPVRVRLPRNFSIQCIFQEPLMVDCQVGGCAANEDIPMSDNAKAWLSEHGRIKNGWSINEDKWWPIWRHIGGDNGITMDHETVARLMGDCAYRKSIAEEIAGSILDIFNLVTK